MLIGADPISGEPAAYVGESEQVGKRLKQHLGREFWNQVILFVSKDENLTKGHINYLEGKLIELGLESGRGVLVNSQASGSRLPEADTAEMDMFLENILKLLPVMGTSLFSPAADQRAKTRPKLICTIKGFKAYGNRTDSGFVVYQSSEAVAEQRKSAGPFVELRQRLIDSGVLKLDGGRYVFTKDHEFGSPSYAAGVVCGGHMNGLTAWKTDAGLSLKQSEASNA